MCEGSGRERAPLKAKLCCTRSGGNLCFGVCFGFAVEVFWGSVLGCDSGCVLGMWFEGVGPPCSLHLRGAIGVANRGALGVGKRGAGSGPTGALQAIATLCVLADHIQDRVNQCGILGVMLFLPVVACNGLPKI